MLVTQLAPDVWVATGPQGCGKSTLATALGCTEYSLEGEALGRVSPERVSGQVYSSHTTRHSECVRYVRGLLL